VLRITVKKEGQSQKVLYLEGKICQEWLQELRDEINRGIEEGTKIILDFSKVRYLDEETAEMLRGLPSDKVEKRNFSLLIQELLKLDPREVK
jgi:anti-anti-sigma regulatory factor